MLDITKVLLVLAALVYISVAQGPRSQRCLCNSVIKRLPCSCSDLMDINFFEQSAFCDKLEIVATIKKGDKLVKYCLDTGMKMVWSNMAKRVNSKRSSTARPDETQVTAAS